MGVIEDAEAQLVPIKVGKASASVLNSWNDGWIRFESQQEWASHIAFALKAMGHYSPHNDIIAEECKFSNKEIIIFQTHPDDIALGAGATAHKYARWHNKVNSVTLSLRWDIPDNALQRCAATLKEAELLGYKSITGITPTQDFINKLKPIVDTYNSLQKSLNDKTKLRTWCKNNVVPFYLENYVALDLRCFEADSIEVMREAVYKMSANAERVLCPSHHDKNEDHRAAASACDGGGRSIANIFRYAGPEHYTNFQPTMFVVVSLEDLAAKMLALQWHQEAFGLSTSRVNKEMLDRLKLFTNEDSTLKVSKEYLSPSERIAFDAISKDEKEQTSLEHLALGWPNGKRFYFDLATQLSRALYYGKWPKGSNNVSPVLAEGFEVENMMG